MVVGPHGLAALLRGKSHAEAVALIERHEREVADRAVSGFRTEVAGLIAAESAVGRREQRAKLGQLAAQVAGHPVHRTTWRAR